MDPVTDFFRRAGRTQINAEMVKHYPADLAKVFSGALVLRCEHIFWRHHFEYTLLHPQFDPIEEGAELPNYTCLVHTDESGATYEWRRA